MTSYDERYGWSAAPNSGRGTYDQRIAQQLPALPPVVKTWTSIDAAKPQWEEQVICFLKSDNTYIDGSRAVVV